MAEAWRSSLEVEFGNYASQHYPHGAYSVFYKLSGNQLSLIACIEDHQFQPKNFWYDRKCYEWHVQGTSRVLHNSKIIHKIGFRNGRWRSRWLVTFDPSAVGEKVSLQGNLKVQVHYYEDGNVQLVSSKDVAQNITIAVSFD